MIEVSAKIAAEEIFEREHAKQRLRPFGISFLDDALLGIEQEDLVLLGAPSGAGKTQIATQIAKANLLAGKKVLFLALEAGHAEIERRLKYSIIQRLYFSDPERPRLNDYLQYNKWKNGFFIDQLASYELMAQAEYEEKFGQMQIVYKKKDFGANELLATIASAYRQVDLIILDHIHYLDLEDDNENRGLKQIAKTIRQVVLEDKTPFVVIAHLRKKDRNNQDLVAGIDEFHGSSDLAKIATKIVTLAPGRPVKGEGFETYLRIPKDRSGSGAGHVIARMIYETKEGQYANDYRLADVTVVRKDIKDGPDEWPDLPPDRTPRWAKNIALSRAVVGVLDAGNKKRWFPGDN